MRPRDVQAASPFTLTRNAFTNGGRGIAFFAPFDNTRYFMPWTPIEVSPLGVRGIFTTYFVKVLLSELLYIWLPTAIFCGLVYCLRKIFSPKQSVQSKST